MTVSTFDNRIANNTTQISQNSQDISQLRDSWQQYTHQIDRNSEKIKMNENGIAMAFAMAGTANLPKTDTFALSAGVGFFESGSAFAVGGAAKIDEGTYLTGRVGVGISQHTVGGRLGLTIGW